MRALGIDPVHDTRETFRALCDALSRPGTVQRAPAAPADHAVLATLLDHEVTTHTTDERLRDTLSSQGRLSASDPEHADIVHTHGEPDWDVRDLARGSLLEPSDGATAIYRVETLSSEPPAEPTGQSEDVVDVCLSGPGVPGTRTVQIGLRSAELERIREAQSTYPRGVDVIFTAGDQIATVPRSATVEVG